MDRLGIKSALLIGDGFDQLGGNSIGPSGVFKAEGGGALGPGSLDVVLKNQKIENLYSEDFWFPRPDYRWAYSSRKLIPFAAE